MNTSEQIDSALKLVESLVLPRVMIKGISTDFDPLSSLDERKNQATVVGGGCIGFC